MGKGTFNCVKWLLTVFNFLFIICGLLICAVGVWILVSPTLVNEVFGRNLSPVISYMSIIIGGIITIISFCGCAGGGLENRCLLCLFFTALCGIFVACLVGAILIAIFRSELGNMGKDQITENIIENYGKSPTWTDFWDQVQMRLKCCGVRDNDALLIYKRCRFSPRDAEGEVILPESCCKRDPLSGALINLKQCQKGVAMAINNRGCADGLMQDLLDRSYYVLAVLIGLGILLICGMVLSLVHLRNIITSQYYQYSPTPI